MNWLNAADEDETEVADEWVERQAVRVHASGGPDGPWGVLHPVAWSYVTGRITAGSVPEWRSRFEANPASVGRTLAMCVPALGPQGPESVRATGGVHAASGATSVIPTVDASPPRPRSARNAVDELRTTHQGLVDAALRGGPAPAMFAEGDQPRVTASGLDAAAISGLPWRARLAAAWERDRFAAFRIVQTFGHSDGDELSRLELAGNPAVVQYLARVQSWAATSGMGAADPLSEDEQDALFPPRNGARA